MIRIPKEPIWAKKGPLLAVFSVLAILILAFGGWFMASWLLISDYQNRLGDVKENISLSMSKLSNGTSGSTYLETIKQVGDELSSQTQYFPNAPDLLGLQLIDDQRRLTGEALRTNLVDLSGVVNKTAQILEYEHFFNSNLSELNQQKRSNLKELKALEAAWREFTIQLSATSPPYVLEDAHKDIVQMIISIYQTVAALPVAFEQGNPMAMSMKQNELQIKMTGLNEVFKLFERLNKQQDTALAGSYKNLETALKD